MRVSLRRVAAVVVAAALLTPLAACSASGSDGDKHVTLEFFHRWPNEPKNTYFKDLVAEFEKENPDITIKTESVLNDAYKDKVKVVAGSSDAPDVLFSWSGSFLDELVKGGNVMKLDSWLKDNPEIKDRFYESQLTPMQVDGVQYGLPVDMQAKLFFYNKDAFAKLGLKVPTTWDEFIDVLDAIKDSGQTPIEFGAKEQWTIAHYIGTLNQRVLPEKTFESDMSAAKGTFENKGYTTALDRFAELTKYMNADMTAVGHETARNAWIAGDAPIMYLQGSEVNYMNDVAFDYGTFNFPSVDGGKGDSQQLTGAPEGFVVSAKTKHPKEALRFLDFMLNKKNGQAFTEKTGELSAVKDAVADSDAPAILKSIAGDIVKASAMTPWLDNAYDPQIVTAYLSQTQMLLGGQRSPEDVMDEVRATAKRVRDAS
ncbi:ABC transporter substrate-binding protein [Leifsonia sp. NPDC058292]|uniref:ABC transporter substrate-binding protein n=1 Tax=Leifsonia sp. NPDC058292 TaxID=3346428 RepID=UPI0036DDD289